MIKEVLLIFKTHLDIGYTNFASKVAEHYIKVFLPQAVELAYKQMDTEERFVWTTGSWLINEALKTDDGTLEKAIRDGLIYWHALPFTSHTELMNEELFSYGLDICGKLDKKFHTKTRGAKMTDVPGHTIACISQLAERGIELLHIGVNPATPLPDVPKAFRWRCGENSVAVIYNAGYGDFCELGDKAVGLCMTNDNLGPLSAEQLKKVYAEARARYPGAMVRAATLNDAADAIKNIDLPEIHDEIGDTWIHGAGSDPKKLCGYRGLLRSLGNNIKKYNFDDSLLLVPEHTWGSNVQVKFPDTDHYLLKDFENYKSPQREYIENTWVEQRNYVKRAAEIVGFDLEKETSVYLPEAKQIDVDIEPPIEISYELFGQEDYERYGNVYYDRQFEWAVWDFSKPGLPKYPCGIFNAKLIDVSSAENALIYKLGFDKEISEFCGLPEFYIIQSGNSYEIQWHGKKANRLPEAFWVKFKGYEENWELHKLGQWIIPPNGKTSPYIHGIWKGVRNSTVMIESLDASLVAPFGRHLLDFGEKGNQDLYFNLYNNVWNTNFPLWYSDDAKFRFNIMSTEQMVLRNHLCETFGFTSKNSIKCCF